jgi:hypothetical protein
VEPEGFEPSTSPPLPGPTSGRGHTPFSCCSPTVETAGVEPASCSLQARGALQGASPREVRTGGVEPPQPEAARLQRAGLTCARHPHREGRPAGFEPTLRGSRPRVLADYTTVTKRRTRSGDDRTRTDDLSPDKRALCALSYAPEVVPPAVPAAGAASLSAGFRTPRKVEPPQAATFCGIARAGFEPASRAHEAREKGPFSTAHEGLAGRDRTCGLRFPKPAGWPTPPQPDESTPGGARTRSFRIESPASSPVRPRGRASSGGRDRTCSSRVTVARLTMSTAPERNGGSRTRTCGTPCALRASNALP